MEKTSVCLQAQASSPGCSLKITIDGKCVFDQPVDQIPSTVRFDVNETESSHVLGIEMYGKTQQHTKIDQQGNILEDLMISINQLEFDGINIDQLMFEKSVYEHDHNGTSEKSTHKFYGNMGCNGTVILRFTTPTYMWLLENM